MERLFRPNYKNSIIGVPATLLDYVGVKNRYPKNKLIAEALKGKYKNIIFMLFDGMGVSVLKKHLKEKDFLLANNKGIMHSVFPPTTTAATTAYLTCKYPAEHGWLGWNMYFEELDKVVDLFTDKESFEQVSIGEGFVRSKLPIEYLDKKLEYRKKYEAHVVGPEYLSFQKKRFHGYTTDEEMYNNLKELCASDKRKIIYCYNSNPDGIMHECGVSSEEASQYIKKMNKDIEKLYKSVEDTLIIISADHGQLDIENRIYLHQYKDICELLVTPPYIDSRAVSFRVKKGARVQFYNLFMKNFGREFVLLTKETVQKLKLFGKKSKYVNQYIGDFIAIGVGKSIIQYNPKGHDEDLFKFKGHHAGLTQDEVEVPLIILEKR
ncbi:MAG: alkaline phosphatase family protein [Clostridia bacterium]|nr:alkaline phosphatase family protein [Clostridia bacterium]